MKCCKLTFGFKAAQKMKSASFLVSELRGLCSAKCVMRANKNKFSVSDICHQTLEPDKLKKKKKTTQSRRSSKHHLWETNSEILPSGLSKRSVNKQGLV